MKALFVTFESIYDDVFILTNKQNGKYRKSSTNKLTIIISLLEQW